MNKIKIRMRKARIARYCTCGAAMCVTVKALPGDDELIAGVGEAFWQRFHPECGQPGHAQCDAPTARRARARAEARGVREEESDGDLS